MKHITEYNHQISSVQEPELPQHIKDVLNYCWVEMKKAKKSWNKELKTDDEIARYLHSLGKAFAINKINNMEKLKFGIDYLYIDDSDWLPSAGKFAKWCNDGYQAYLTRKQLVDNTKRIMYEKMQIGAQTWEERQKTARSELSALREIIKK